MNNSKFSAVLLCPDYQNLCIGLSNKLMPFNLAAQYHIIQEALAKHELFYSNYKLRTCFHTFFEEDLTLMNPEDTDWKQVLSCLCQKLCEKNYTDPDFEEKVFRWEYAATTAFGNIAIPHSAYMDTIKTSIALAISRKGVPWGSGTVHLVLLLAINKADKKTSVCCTRR